ncbi:MlaD family protein [Nocardia sp. BMG111209]|uniref:MlaD family protein n=1 Tax=Nocardia sp. BMG111209 TaxID=1160137 RepID=UPI000365AD4E|nr:MlaD family protein [Nocardia sp. BMG111209]
MPVYTMPGTGIGQRHARMLGTGAVLLVVLVAVVWRIVPADRPTGEIRVALLTEHVGEGIGTGTDVRFDGVRVGSVTALSSMGLGRQRITLSLQHSQLFGLTDGMSVDYAPGNLFGISALQLHPGSGGNILDDGSTVDLTGSAAGRVADATLSTLLQSTGSLTGEVLTPRLSALLGDASRDFTAFTPLFQAIGTTARAFTETQQLPPSVLFARYGSVLAGLPPMLDGGLRVIYAAYTNEYFSAPEHLTHYNDYFHGIQYQLLPAVIHLSGTGQQYAGGFVPIVTQLLDSLTASLGAGGSGPQLSELLDRLRASFHDSPDGPVLNTDVEVDLGTMPAVAAPLSALLAPGGH